jgi:hypothetical protein
MEKVNNATSTTVPHLYLPETALNAESNSYTATLCFNVHDLSACIAQAGTLQINQSNFLVSNNFFNQGT